MDGSSFDRITRRLAVTTTRRGGVAALVAGVLGIAGISAAEARLEIPPACLGVGTRCTSGDECCSGRCVDKDFNTSRCARTTSNRPDKKKVKKKRDGGGGGDACLEDGDTCYFGDYNCCSGDFNCFQPISSFVPGGPSECKACGAHADTCIGPGGDQGNCCSGLLCEDSQEYNGVMNCVLS